VIAMRTPLHLSPRLPRLAGRKGDDPARLAFTLIELLVVVVIITVLASLSLAGLAGARQRAKIDKTRSTIRKIDAIIRPMYDSYRTRRVAVASSANRRTSATAQLAARRTLMLYEMPDTWSDVPATSSALLTLPGYAQTAAVRSYLAYRTGLTTRTDAYASAECLFMIVTRSGFDPESLEQFRADEIGDIDTGSGGAKGDGAREFWDGWGRPIAFKRWAPGFVTDLPTPDPSIPSSLTTPRRTWSPVQVADKDNAHDPMDPLRCDVNAYALTPLIYSPGRDESTNDPNDSSSDGYGLEAVSVSVTGLCDPVSNKLNGMPKSSGTAADNITNHDLTKK
jgi:prepilin-type N-terminal cleavage/methylation domain-containing protein